MIPLERKALIYQIATASFSLIVLLSNIISAKMMPLPLLSGMSIPLGLITYPLTFLIANFVTEIYGKKTARQMVYIALAMNVLAYLIIKLALVLPSEESTEGAFEQVMGLSGMRIFASLLAYFISQIVDIQLYAFIRKWTGQRFLWLSNNGSTLCSQMVDTLIIDTVFLYFGLGMRVVDILPIMLFSYLYKMLFSLINTPLFYLFLLGMKKVRPSKELSP